MIAIVFMIIYLKCINTINILFNNRIPSVKPIFNCSF